MSKCRHENQLRGTRTSGPDVTVCGDCGVLLQLTDPVIAGIVDTVPRDYRMQLRIAAVIASAR